MNNISIAETKELMECCLNIGMSEENAVLRCLDVGFVMRATGVDFKSADIVCLDMECGFTIDAGFKTGWDLCRKLVVHNNLKKI